MLSSSFPRALPPELPQALPSSGAADDAAGNAAHAAADPAHRTDLPSRGSSVHGPAVRCSTLVGTLHRHGRAADRVFVTVTRTTRSTDDETGVETSAATDAQEQWTLPGFAVSDEAEAEAATGIDADGGGSGGGGGSEMAQAPAAVERSPAADAVTRAAAVDATRAAAPAASAAANGTPAAASVAPVEPVKAPRVVAPPRGHGARQTLNIIGAGLAVAVVAIIAALLISHGAPKPADGTDDDRPPPASPER